MASSHNIGQHSFVAMMYSLWKYVILEVCSIIWDGYGVPGGCVSRSGTERSDTAVQVDRLTYCSQSCTRMGSERIAARNMASLSELCDHSKLTYPGLLCEGGAVAVVSGALDMQTSCLVPGACQFSSGFCLWWLCSSPERDSGPAGLPGCAQESCVRGKHGLSLVR